MASRTRPSRLIRVQRSPLVIIARARREGPGDEVIFYIHVYI